MRAAARTESEAALRLAWELVGPIDFWDALGAASGWGVAGLMEESYRVGVWVVDCVVVMVGPLPPPLFLQNVQNVGVIAKIL
jgi:hypothetical protein